MIIVLRRVRRRPAFAVSSPAIRSIGIYWHFVDAVWLIVFLVVYLAPHLSKQMQ
ncbi:hypothetical protein ACQ86N_30345 [Puia sp. P3]|uniref:hypothetical protein n=1 Tax=Puia sp. P3 TaxID=3423952 RepID=UPI003D67836B